jgi:hypothetical protein
MVLSTIFYSGVEFRVEVSDETCSTRQENIYKILFGKHEGRR